MASQTELVEGSEGNETLELANRGSTGVQGNTLEAFSSQTVVNDNSNTRDGGFVGHAFNIHIKNESSSRRATREPRMSPAAQSRSPESSVSIDRRYAAATNHRRSTKWIFRWRVWVAAALLVVAGIVIPVSVVKRPSQEESNTSRPSIGAMTGTTVSPSLNPSSTSQLTEAASQSTGAAISSFSAIQSTSLSALPPSVSTATPPVMTADGNYLCNFRSTDKKIAGSAFLYYQKINLVDNLGQTPSDIALVKYGEYRQWEGDITTATFTDTNTTFTAFVSEDSQDMKTIAVNEFVGVGENAGSEGQIWRNFTIYRASGDTLWANDTYVYEALYYAG